MAAVLGVISPNTNTSNVSAPEPILIAHDPHICWKKMVVIDEAAMFTMLLPIRIALSILSGFSFNVSTSFAFLLPLSANDLSRIVLTVVNAVSEDEKNADIASKIIIVINCII